MSLRGHSALDEEISVAILKPIEKFGGRGGGSPAVVARGRSNPVWFGGRSVLRKYRKAGNEIGELSAVTGKPGPAGTRHHSLPGRPVGQGTGVGSVVENGKGASDNGERFHLAARMRFGSGKTG